MASLTKEKLQELRDAIHDGKDSHVQELVSDLHAADIGALIDQVDTTEAKYLFRLLDGEIAAEAIMEMDEHPRGQLLEAFTAKEIAGEIISRMDSDDSADILPQLGEEKKKEVLGHLEDLQQATDIVDLLTYDENTAGGLMAKELIRVNENWSISRCIREMRRQADSVRNIHTIYVVDDQNILKGTLSLQDLLFSSSSVRTTVKELYEKNLTAVEAHRKAEEVAKIMEKYDLVVLPVVDEHQKLLGRITIDDVVDVIRDEAKKDYQMASGISEHVESTYQPLRMARSRLPWLIIGLIGGIVGAQVIGLYEEQISIDPRLAYFIPLIAAMGGNVGIQSSAIVVQSIANKTLDLESALSKVGKEFIVGIFNGLICSSLLLGVNYFFTASYLISFTVSIALLAVIIFAAMFGTLTPLVLNKARIDPALATGPFITTINDIFGIFIYFFVAHYMYL